MLGLLSLMYNTTSQIIIYDLSKFILYCQLNKRTWGYECLSYIVPQSLRLMFQLSFIVLELNFPTRLASNLQSFASAGKKSPEMATFWQFCSLFRSYSVGEEKMASHVRANVLISSTVTYRPSSPSAPRIHSTICCSCTRGIPKDSDKRV